MSKWDGLIWESPPLPPGVHLLADGELLVHVDADGTARAARNRCRHQGGRFALPADGSVIVTCPRHGWTLDTASMEYRSPACRLRQRELTVEKLPAGGWRFCDSDDRDEFTLRERPSLTSGELTIRFYAHACVEIRLGDRVIFTDPWLEGPALCGGWWLSHRPPADWLERLAAADRIYISHNHSDHLHPQTLARLAGRNRDVEFLIPDFASLSVEGPLRRLGFHRIQRARLGQPIALDAETRVTLFPDGGGREDSALLVEYKGCRILNTVDCNNVNDGRLPSGVDVLLAPFAGGSSGFPVCWQDLYGEARVGEMLARNRRAVLEQARELTRRIRPRVFIPFAGYFTPALPIDSEIRGLNRKNSVSELRALLLGDNPSLLIWEPAPGAMLDLSDPRPAAGETPLVPPTDFDRELRQIARSLEFEPLKSLDGVRRYFEWTGYRANHLLHVIETDDSFQRVLREFRYDFQAGALVNCRPQRSHQYTRMKVRARAFRYALQMGIPWEELASSFQARFFRSPDCYEWEFWDYFQNRLPATPPFPEASP